MRSQCERGNEPRMAEPEPEPQLERLVCLPLLSPATCARFLAAEAFPAGSSQRALAKADAMMRTGGNRCRNCWMSNGATASAPRSHSWTTDSQRQRNPSAWPVCFCIHTTMKCTDGLGQILANYCHYAWAALLCAAW